MMRNLWRIPALAALLAAGVLAACTPRAASTPATAPAAAPTTAPSTATAVAAAVASATPAPPALPPSPLPACASTLTTLAYVRLRSGPGMAYRTLAVLPAGASAAVIARTDDGAWILAEYDGQQGWMFADLARLDCQARVATPVPSPAVPPTPTPAATPIPARPPTIDFRADPAEIMAGECAGLIWAVADARSVILDDGAGELVVPPAGDRRVCPLETRAYTLRVIGLDGGQEVRTAAVAVRAPRSIAFAVSPQYLVQGECATVAWVVTGDARDGAITLYRDSLAQSQPVSGAARFCPAASTGVSLVVEWADGGRDRRSLDIRVAPGPASATALPRLAELRASPDRISPGQCALITWQVRGELPGDVPVLQASGADGGADGAASSAASSAAAGVDGSLPVCPTVTQAYTLRGRWADGTPFERRVLLEVVGTAQPD